MIISNTFDWNNEDHRGTGNYVLTKQKEHRLHTKNNVSNKNKILTNSILELTCEYRVFSIKCATMEFFSIMCTIKIWVAPKATAWMYLE